MGVDLHVDTVSRLLDAGGDFSGPRPDLHVDLDRCQRGSVQLLLTALFIADDDPAPAQRLDRMLDLAQSLDRSPTCSLKQVTTPTAAAALESDEVGFLLTVENACTLGQGLDPLQLWWQRGVRVVGLTWNGANALGNGVGVADSHLTELGREAVLECRRLGIAIDISHLCAVGVDDVFELDVPVLATHCNSRAVHDHPRNLTDSQLRRLAERDGIVGLNFYPPFLAAADANLACIAKHAAHIAEQIGAAHVAIGSDLDGIGTLPEGFEGYESLEKLDGEFMTVGFDQREIDGIRGQNFLRWWKSIT